MDLPGMQHLDMQRSKTRLRFAGYTARRAGRYVERHVLAPPYRALTLPEGGRCFETQATDWAEVLSSTR